MAYPQFTQALQSLCPNLEIPEESFAALGSIIGSTLSGLIKAGVSLMWPAHAFSLYAQETATNPGKILWMCKQNCRFNLILCDFLFTSMVSGVLIAHSLSLIHGLPTGCQSSYFSSISVCESDAVLQQDARAVAMNSKRTAVCTDDVNTVLHMHGFEVLDAERPIQAAVLSMKLLFNRIVMKRWLVWTASVWIQ